MNSQGKAAAVAEFLSGKLSQVDVPAIERELRQLWQQAATHGGSGDDLDVARSCVLNLILYSLSGKGESPAGDLLDAIMMHHPCRALLAVVEPEENKGIEAWVSARCHLAGPGSTRQICGEQISVHSGRQGTIALPSVVVPLLVPDLPVFLWWRDGIPDRQALEPFLPVVDRLIFDSLSWRADKDSFGAIHLTTGGVDKPYPVDLNWQRLLHWRHLTAKSFDSLDLGLELSALNEIERLTLEFAPGGEGQVALLTGWLAGKLGWRPISATAGSGGKVFSFDLQGKNIEVKWRQAATEIVPAGSLLTLEMELTCRRVLTLALVLIDGKPALNASMKSPTGTSRRVIGRGPQLNELELVLSQLDILEQDKVYSESFAMAEQIIALLEKQ